MPVRRRIPRTRAGATAPVLIALAMLVAGCGASATPSPSPTPAPSPSPTSSPIAIPSASASPSPVVDPTEQVAIDPPFTLDPLPEALADQLESSLTNALAGYGGLFSIGARQISRDGQAEGFLVVMRLPPVLAESPAAMEQIVAGVGAGSEPTQRVIEDATVTFFEKEGQQFSLFPIEADLYMVFGTTVDSVTAMTTALVSANG